MMDSAGQPPATTTNIATLGKTFAKILRLRRKAAAAGRGGDVPEGDKDYEIDKLKSDRLDNGYSSTNLSDDINNEKQQRNREAMESLLANLFAGVSAVKAAYAQLQAAQAPYDPETVQSADQAVVAELQRLSELKQCYLKRQIPDPQSALTAQIREQRSLITTYKITTQRLESDLDNPVADIPALRSTLSESERENHALEARLHPRRSLSAIEGLHLSGLSPPHFLTVLRYTVSAVRSFVKLMVKEMESAGWDADAAAGTVHPGIPLRPGHTAFAFESYVCQMMFSDFQHRDFSLGSLDELAKWDRRLFFEEFTQAKAVDPRHFLRRPGAEQSLVGKFLRVKYLLLVHPKMEATVAGDLVQRGLVSSGNGFPSSGFFAAFADMGWRVWLLHCLFFSFGDGEEGCSVFQARRGCRFSEVYMESVVDEEVEAARGRPTVGFNVVPGFRVGRTVLQCRVYLSKIRGDKGAVLRERRGDIFGGKVVSSL